MIDGAEFSVKNLDTNTLVWEGVVEGGFHSLDNLDPGWYRISEIATASGYVMEWKDEYGNITSNYKDIKLEADKEVDIKFDNVKRPELEIRKVDSAGGPVKGAIFEFTKADNSFMFRKTTDENGTILVSYNDAEIITEEGIYSVKEVQAPEGYFIGNPEAQTIKLENGMRKVLTFTNMKLPTLTIEKINGQDGKPIEGVKFELSRADGSLVGTFTTGADGKVVAGLKDSVTGYLQPGVYTVKETFVPKPYVLDTGIQMVELKAGDNKSVMFKNLPEGTVEVFKYDEQTLELLPNAEFRITKKDDASGVIKEGVTDKDGKFDIPELQPDWYTITEIKAPPGYIATTEEKHIQVNAGDKIIVKFDNIKKPTLTIQKIDEQTGKPIPGVKFDIRKTDGSSGGIYTTGADGTVTAGLPDSPNGYLEEGSYIVTEIFVPDPYVLDKTPQVVDLKGGDKKSLIFQNLPEGTVEVFKYDEKTLKPLKDAEFRITKKDDASSVIKEGITDDKGQFVIPSLSPDWYTITEIKAPPGYIGKTEPKHIQVNAGDKLVVKFDNIERPKIKIVKVDKADGKIITAPVTFDVSIADGKSLGTFTTKDGVIILSHATGTDLDEGTYTITELIAPPGYKLDDSPQTISVVGGDDKTVTFHDEKLPGLTLQKKDAVTGALLEGAEFEITVTDGTSQKSYHYTTDKTGIVTITDLPVGTYSVKEIKTPKNYILDPQHQDVKLEWGDSKILYFNDTLLPTLVIQKTNAVTMKGVPNTTFRVDYEQANGGLKTIGTYKTDAKGQIVLPFVQAGWYSITETIPAQGMSLGSKPTSRIYLEAGQNSYLDGGTANVSNSSSGTSTTPYTVTSGFAYPVVNDVVNYPLNSIVIKKSDINTGKLLEGANFVLYKTDGSVSGGVVGTAIGTFTTDASGVIVIGGLEPGYYVVKETKAPQYYLMDVTNQQNGFLKADGTSVLEFSFANIPYGAILITKVDGITGVPLANAKFKVTDNAGKVVGNTTGEFITDSKGEILIPNVAPGNYLATEIQAPENYAINTTPKTIQVGTDGKTYKMSFDNYPFGNLVLKKLDTDTKEPLEGAVFKVSTSKGDVVGTSNGEFTTDAKGTITIPNLPKGSYVLEEIKSPTGYILENQSKTFDVDYGKSYTIDFFNKKMSSMQIVKIDGKTKQPLKDAEFKVYKMDGELLGTYKTDGEGLILFDKLQAGWYKIVETKAPTGYLIDDTAQDVEITGNQFVKVVFENMPMSSLVIKKFDSLTKQPLMGATFKITHKAGDVVGEYSSDYNGLIQIDNLDPGWYTATEISAPVGYKLFDGTKDFQVTNTKTITLEFPNQKLTSLVIKKVDEKNNAPLSGAKFLVEKQNGEYVGEYTTDSDGTINIPTLTPDFYIIREKQAPAGYLLDESPKTVQVKTDSPTVVTFTNKYMSGLQIIKVDAESGVPLPLAKFTVYKKSGDIVGDYVTDKNGVIIIDQLENGWYKIAETKAPAGYVISEEPKDIEIKGNNFHKIVFKNKKMSSLIIKKVDSIDKKVLEGAKFEVVKVNGEKIGEFTTDKSGLINVPNLKPDFYLIKETKAPEGYSLNSTPQTIEMKTDKPLEVVFENTPLAGLQIKKINSETRQPIEGVEFMITKMNGEKVGTFKTDRQGMIFVNNLDVGSYIVTETKAAEGYLDSKEPKIIEITSKGKPILLEIENKPVSSLLIFKTDMMTGKPLAGVIFDVKRADGKRIQGNILDQNMPQTENNSPNKSTTLNGDISGSYTTDANGRILINYLAPGEYHIIETKQLPGYELDTEVHTVTVTAGKQAVVKVQNKALSGLKILKIDSITKAPIFNVEFMVFDSNNKVVGTFYTDNMGVIDFAAVLTEGRYTIRETRAASGYFRDDLPRTVEFIAGKYTEIVWENIPEAGQIQITKLSANDNEINGLPAGTELEGAIFEVYAHKSGNLVDRFITGSNGRGVSKPLPVGRYTIKETQAPPYYKLSKKELDIEIEFAKQIVKLEFTNESANTGVSIDKVGSLEVMPGNNTRYDIKTVRNNSSVPLTDFYWRDVLPVDAVRLDKIVTGMYNQSLKYKVMVTTNKGNSIVVADNMMTTKNNVISCTNADLGLANDEFVTSFTLHFGNVKAGFSSVEEPKVYVNVLNKNLPNGYKFANKVDIGGKYQGEWVVGNSTWVTTIYVKTPAKLPKTGN